MCSKVLHLRFLEKSWYVAGKGIVYLEMEGMLPTGVSFRDEGNGYLLSSLRTMFVFSQLEECQK